MELTAVTAAWAGPCSTAGTGTEEGAELGAGQGATWHEDRRLTHRDISSTSEVGQITWLSLGMGNCNSVFGNPIEVKLHTYNCLQGKCRSQPRLGGQWILVLAVLQPVLLISLGWLLDWFLLCCLNMIAWKSVQILTIGFYTVSYLRKCFYLMSLSNRSSCRSKMSKNIIWNLPNVLQMLETICPPIVLRVTTNEDLLCVDVSAACNINFILSQWLVSIWIGSTWFGLHNYVCWKQMYNQI